MTATSLLAGLATEETLEAVRALLADVLEVSGPLTAAELAAAGLASASGQASIVAGLATIAGHVDGLEATSASILGKLSSDPATQTTLAAVLAKLSSDPATQTTLEAVRALMAGNLSAIAPPPTSTTVQIALGQSLSAAAQVDGKLVGIILPSAGWTTAAVTFDGSPDGSTYSPIYDAGVERAIASDDAVAGRMILLPLSDWLGVKFVKIRSGTVGTPVNQAAARTITILKVA